MNDEEPRIDREASDAIKRMERQQFLDGKLDKAYAMEGAGILFLPLVLAVAEVIGWALTSLGLEGPAVVFVGAPLLVGLVFLVALSTADGEQRSEIETRTHDHANSESNHCRRRHPRVFGRTRRVGGSDSTRPR